MAERQHGERALPGSAAPAGPGPTVERLWREHGRFVFLVAFLRLGDHALAEDVCQETFLRAFRWLERYAQPEKPAWRAWLKQIAVNCIRDQRRRRTLPVAQAAGDGEGCDPVDALADSDAADPSLAVSRAEMARLVRACIERLDAALRRVVELCSLGGLDAAAAGIELGLHANAVRQRLHRARHRLRDCLESGGAVRAREGARAHG